MPVVLNNSNSSPATLGGAYATTTPPPRIIEGSTSSQVGTEPIYPVQVIGLVPVFPCCNKIDAFGGFKFGTYDNVACVGINITLDIVLGGVDLGTFTYNNTQSNATIQAAIQALLPAGWNCVVSGVPMNQSCIIYAPVGSGINGNKTLVITKTNNGCGGLIGKPVNISGGVDNGSDCLNCDCRDGLYKADTIPDDRNFTLPVFADLTCTDGYHNDLNQWVFQYSGSYDPIQSKDFNLQQLINGTWSNVAVLNDSTYGSTILTLRTCNAPVNYGGYQLNWNLVLQNLGEGTYRFNVSGIGSNKVVYCLQSPPFCLKQFDCHAADGMVKFETINTGGNYGSVTSQGQSWSLCCVDPNTGDNTPLSFIDSIRFYAMFGYETADLQRDYVKYAPGVINKVRDEAIKNFTLKTSQLPMWLHQRLYAYALMSDQLFVSDYNINNSDYNIKHFWVVADSNYTPKYSGSTRYSKILDLKFKEGQQFVFRDRCCGVVSIISPNTGTSPGTGTGTSTATRKIRQWKSLIGHNWKSGTPANWK